MSIVDILIVGGGISGLGIAGEAARCGLDVLLLERGDFAQGTSASSLRIIHGGLRYLQSLDLRRVLESAREQSHWLREAPNCIAPLPCLMPLEAGGLRSAWPMRAAAKMYQALAKSVGGPPGPARVLNSGEAKELVPAFEAHLSRGAFLWHDAILTDPSEFVRMQCLSAEQQGALLKTGEEVTCLRRTANWEVETAQGGLYRSRLVVNASGPAIFQILPQAAPPALARFPSGWCKALNVEFDFLLDPSYALSLRSRAGRLFFCVPRGAHSVLGTWYYPVPAHKRSPAEEREVQEKELEKFLSEASTTFADSRFSRSHIVSREAGILPMRRMTPSGPELYGRHRIQSWNSYVQVMSTKYTTFRLQAAEVLERAKPFLSAR